MSEISLEELLSAVKDAENKKRQLKKNPHRKVAHMDRFVDQMNIKPGATKIPTYMIWYTYKRVWQGIKRDHKKNKITFFRTFNQRFVQKRDGKQRYYLLDESAFDMTREGKLKAKHYDEKYREKVKEKRRKKSKPKKEIQPKS